MTQSTIKTRSSKGGGTDNFNEIKFEDKKGSELLFIHAEKDQTIEVENDESHWVGHDRTKTIDHDETTHVRHDRTETVDQNETITRHGNLAGNTVTGADGKATGKPLTIPADEQITIQTGPASITMKKDGAITIK